MPYHSYMDKNKPMGSKKKKLSKKTMDRLKEHSKAHKGGMMGKHMKNMKKFMEGGDTFSTAHTKAMKEDKKNKAKQTDNKKMGVAEIGGEKIPFRIGALHDQLKTPKGYKFTRATLNKLKNVENGKKFDFLGKSFTMTDKLKKRISFGLVLMGKKK